MATDATGTPTSPDSIARILPSDLPAVTTLTSGVNAIADTTQTALNNYLRKTSGNVVNADINASAAIVYTKLSLANSIRNADILTTAAIAMNKIAAAPYCIAVRGNASGSQAFGSASGTWSFSTAIDNTGAMWVGGSPTRITMTQSGNYAISVDASISASGGMTSSDLVRIFKNGTTTLAQAGSLTALAGGLRGEVGVFGFTAADYIELTYVRSAGTAVATTVPASSISILSPGAEYIHFGAVRVQYLGS